MLATVVATTATLSSNSCKSASLFTHFTSVLRKQYAANDTFLREANGYKRSLAIRNARLDVGTTETQGSLSEISPPPLGTKPQLLHGYFRYNVFSKGDR